MDCYQDFDICGPTDAMVSEVQCLRVCCDILAALELNEPFKILISHKKMTESILRLASNISDSQAVKLVNKIADDNVRSGINWSSAHKQLCDSKIADSAVTAFRDLIARFNGTFDTALAEIEKHEQLNGLKEARPVINDLLELRRFCKAFLSEADYQRVHFDFNLVGSNNFYTGLVFAAQLELNGWCCFLIGCLIIGWSWLLLAVH